MNPVEMNVDGATLHRFGAKHWLETTPDRFYLNFLDCNRVHAAKHRFAGSMIACGFYFSPFVEVALMEAMHYRRFSRVGSADPIHFLRMKHSEELCLLSVTVKNLKILDLRFWESLDWLNKRHHVIKFGKADNYVNFYKAILSQGEGGGDIEDVLGAFSKKEGFDGIAFPSRRALDCVDESLWLNEPFYGRFIGKIPDGIHAGDECGIFDTLQSQLISEYNIVLFGGSLTTRSIVRYSILCVDGSVTSNENLYFDATPAFLSELRVNEANSRRLSATDAATLGLADDDTLSDNYEENFFWVPIA